MGNLSPAFAPSPLHYGTPQSAIVPITFPRGAGTAYGLQLWNAELGRNTFSTAFQTPTYNFARRAGVRLHVSSGQLSRRVRTTRAHMDMRTGP